MVSVGYSPESRQRVGLNLGARITAMRLLPSARYEVMNGINRCKAEVDI